jgi:hypothetical protein
MSVPGEGGSDSQRGSSLDLQLARRLIAVAVSDFACWFPIGLLALLSKAGTPISGKVSTEQSKI